MPNLGCMLGTAYQVLVGQLGAILEQEVPEITVPEYLILRALYSKDGLQQCEIAEAIGKDKGAICRSVKALVKKDMVRTEALSHKCLKVYLTPKAESLKGTILDIANRRQRALEEICSSEELSTFRSCLSRIINSAPV